MDKRNWGRLNITGQKSDADTLIVLEEACGLKEKSICYVVGFTYSRTKRETVERKYEQDPIEKYSGYDFLKL